MEEHLSTQRPPPGIPNEQMDATQHATNPSLKRTIGSDEESSIAKKFEKEVISTVAEPKGNPRLYVATNADKIELLKVAGSMWREHTTDVQFSQAQSEQVIKFASSAMAFAMERVGVSLKTALDEPLRNLKETIMHEITEKIEQRAEKEVSVAKPKIMSYSQVCGMAKAREQSNASTNSESVKEEMKEKKASERSCFAVIQPDNPDSAAPDRADDWITVLSRKSQRENMKITRIHKTKNDNLAVHFADPAERRKFEETLRKDPIKGAHVRSSADQKVAFAIRGVPAKYDAKTLMHEIMSRNSEHKFVKKGRIDLMDARSQQEGITDTRQWKTFKLVTNAKDASLLLEDSFFYIDLTRVRVSLWKPSKRCGTCHGLNHLSRDCRSEVICKYCAGNHVSYQCQKRKLKSEHMCIVCKRLKKPCDHAADPDGCDVLYNEADAEMKKIYALIKANHG